jgi:hypothetical protein
MLAGLRTEPRDGARGSRLAKYGDNPWRIYTEKLSSSFFGGIQRRSVLSCLPFFFSFFLFFLALFFFFFGGLRCFLACLLAAGVGAIVISIFVHIALGTPPRVESSVRPSLPMPLP